MQSVIYSLAETQGISSFSSSRLFQTTPVSPIPQSPYLNSVCFFKCQLSLPLLWKTLEFLEQKEGKRPKSKAHPRPIDIDLLFYGDTVLYSPELVVPHPRWHERLFVLAPLSDLVDTIKLPFAVNVGELKSKFLNPHREKVTPLDLTLPYSVKGVL